MRTGVGTEAAAAATGAGTRAAAAAETTAGTTATEGRAGTARTRAPPTGPRRCRGTSVSSRTYRGRRHLASNCCCHVNVRLGQVNVLVSAYQRWPCSVCQGQALKCTVATHVQDAPFCPIIENHYQGCVSYGYEITISFLTLDKESLGCVLYLGVTYTGVNTVILSSTERTMLPFERFHTPMFDARNTPSNTCFC